MVKSLQPTGRKQPDLNQEDREAHHQQEMSLIKRNRNS